VFRIQCTNERTEDLHYPVLSPITHSLVPWDRGAGVAPVLMFVVKSRDNNIVACGAAKQ
jgi:hypothetical protein